MGIQQFGLLAIVSALGACAMTPPLPRPWSLQNSATAGAALIYHDGEEEALRMMCRRNPADFLVVPDGFVAAPGNATLTLQTEGAELRLSASALPGMSNAVEAKGPLTQGIVALIASGAPITISYGDQTATIPAPDPSSREAFITACRAAMQSQRNG